MKILKNVLIALMLLTVLSGCAKEKPIEISTERRVTEDVPVSSATEISENDVNSNPVIGADINIISKSYADFVDFVADTDSLLLAEHKVNTDSTLLYALMQRITDAQAMYVDITDTEETVTCVYAVAGENMYVNFNAENVKSVVSADSVVDAGFNVLAEMTVIVKGNTLYFLDEDTKVCYYTEADYEEIDSLGYTDAIRTILDMSALDKLDTLDICIVDIAGQLYQLEVYDTAGIVGATSGQQNLCGYLFDVNGDLCYYKAFDYGVVFNAITEQVPAGMFDVSNVYTMVSMDEMYGR